MFGLSIPELIVTAFAAVICLAVLIAAIGINFLGVEVTEQRAKVLEIVVAAMVSAVMLYLGAHIGL